MKVCVLGNGAWGSSLSQLLVGNGCDVYLWGRRIKEIGGLSSAVHQSLDLGECLSGSDLVIMALSAQGLREVCVDVGVIIGDGGGYNFLSAAKGLESGSHRFPSQIISEVLSGCSVGVLSGPNFADEIMGGFPAASVVAGADSVCDLAIASIGQRNFRIYRQSPLSAVEICGVVKNVIAIACGICGGMGLGENARVALLTRGLSEVGRLAVGYASHNDAVGYARHNDVVGYAKHNGGDIAALDISAVVGGLAGVGDLVLTCGSLQSRNMAFGYALGGGASVSEALEGSRGVCEGFLSVESIIGLARGYGLDLPIIEAVGLVVSGGCSVEGAMDSLLDRPFGVDV